jgi:uncharacterized protein YkwD
MGDGMRKPLVVVCAVTAVAMAAGGVAATTAGADTTPEVPAPPAASAEVPELPQLSALPQLPTGPAGAALPEEPAQHPATSATADRPADTRPSRPAHARPGAPASAQDDADGPAGPGTPASPRPAGQDDRHHPAAQRPDADAVAASHRDVTADSVSTDPSAPVQQQVLALVNENRERGGCPDVSLDRRLILTAQGHAADMAKRDYFAHESPDGQGAGERVSDAGYRWSRYGENIARGQDSPYEVVDGWMHSPEHRENIMDCRLDEMGIGLAFDGERTPYWVQDFATPMA